MNRTNAAGRPTPPRSGPPADGPGTFRCSECGAGLVQWVGRCPQCKAWGSVAESAPVRRRAVAAGAVTNAARPIVELDVTAAAAQPTGVSELDRVLGGGLVPGSVVLLAGEPGVGKSTLLLDVAHRFALGTDRSPSGRERRALIVTGEESTAQVRLRAERTGSLAPRLYLAAENDLAALVRHVDDVDPGLLVVDSVQTISTDGIDSGAGSVAQIRAVAAAVIALAKSRDMATILVGHVTKDGGVAGPRVLEHLVDVVLHFEGDRHSPLRLVRAAKNRFGAADEVGCFEMREDGIVGLADPSGLFLSDREHAVPGTCVTVTMEGRRPLVTEVQALVGRASTGGSPRRAVSDLDPARVAMLLAVLDRQSEHGGAGGAGGAGSANSAGRAGFAEQEVYAATVGGLAAREPAADLAVALALACAAGGLSLPPTLCAVGEVSLAGDVRRVPALGRRLAEAARLGFTAALVPTGYPDRAGGAGPATNGIRTVPVATLRQALDLAAGMSTRPGAPAQRRVLRAVPAAQ